MVPKAGEHYPGAMAEIVNLNRARKSRDRKAAEAKAAANRKTHGRTKAERARDAAAEAARDALLDGARIEDRDPKAPE